MKLKLLQYKQFLDEVKNCNECNLCNKLTLPGTGNIYSNIMCIGISPSKWRTFNLTFGMKSRPYFEEFLNILGLTRNDVWATNVVKCIEYGKRTGDPAKCIKYLRREIEIINPRIIITFGTEAAKWVLGSKPAYIRGQRYMKNGRTVYVAPHPMICVYREEKGHKRFIEVARKIKKDISNKTLLEYLSKKEDIPDLELMKGQTLKVYSVDVVDDAVIVDTDRGRFKAEDADLLRKLELIDELLKTRADLEYVKLRL